MISIKTEQELDLMRRSGEVLRSCFLRIEEVLLPGVTTGELDRVAEEFIRSNDSIPAFKGYRGYPASVCTSVNEEVVHGIPGPRELKEGDIVGIDM
ncbi:MAG: M24 family metallopeptidase, partial [Candidatus Krumholzibacteria bacterium]|nr:M24 family metallopeptidase [Candidatus Krumholzibacteria bacterium]